jgi:sorbitol/mannitol transport system permease protein
MATKHTQGLGRLFLMPTILCLALFSVVPLLATAYFALFHYSLLDSAGRTFAGLENFHFVFTDPALWQALVNSLILVATTLVITVLGGIPLALLLNEPMFGRDLARAICITPFFVMPTVNALIWKNLLLNPVSGVFSWFAKALGLSPIDWFSEAPLAALVALLSWQWLPFAMLIFLTALQSLNTDQMEAAKLDGATPLQAFMHVILPHLQRPIAIVILIEAIFLLGVFAEIFVTTGGGPGVASTNLTFLVFSQALIQFDAGAASAIALFAVLIANVLVSLLAAPVAGKLEG